MSCEGESLFAASYMWLEARVATTGATTEWVLESLATVSLADLSKDQRRKQEKENGEKRN